MSVKVMGRVWELDLPANEKFVLLALADHADHDGNNVFPGLELIAFKTGYTTQQVRRIERKLETRKILIAVSRKPGKRIEYRIDMNAGTIRQRLHTDKMSPPDPLHSDTPTPDISSIKSSGINHQEPSLDSPDGEARNDAKPKKPRAPHKNAPWHDALLRCFRLTPETVSKTADRSYWIAAADLAGINFPVDKIQALYDWCDDQDWPNFSVMALAKYAGEWLANDEDDDPYAKLEIF